MQRGSLPWLEVPCGWMWAHLQVKATYIDLARKIVAGTYSGEFYYQPFYYAVFLPLIYLLCGGVWTVAVVQCLLGGATVWFAGLSAENLFSRFSALSAAFLVAVSTALLLYAPFHLNETLQAFNLTLLFYLVLIAVERRKWYWWAICGSVADPPSPSSPPWPPAATGLPGSLWVSP